MADLSSSQLAHAEYRLERLLHLPRYDGSPDAAVIGTADATWALFYVTTLAALATLGTLIVAVWLPYREIRKANREMARTYKERRLGAAKAIRKVLSLENEIHDALDPKRIPGRENISDIWTFLNGLHRHERLLEYQFKLDGGNEQYAVLILQSLQSIYEVRDACERLTSEPIVRSAGWQNVLREERKNVRQSLSRCKNLEHDLSLLEKV